MKLFVISTPSQAFFLSKTSGLLNENAILLITKNNAGIDEKIITQLQRFPWARTLIWDITGIESPTAYYKIFLFRFKIFMLRNKNKRITEIFIGSYDNLFHLGIVAEFEDIAKVYLLYDGLQIISVAEKRAESRKKSLRVYTKIFKLAGFKTPSLRSITYTSPLNFKVPVFDEVIKIKPSFNKAVDLRENLMYFAGQPLVDIGLVSLEIYLEKLSQLTSEFPLYQIIYIPHPKESEHVLADVAKIFKLRHFRAVFEQEYLEAEFFAKNIVSFYSSVLMNLFYLGAGEINIYAITLSSQEILSPENKDTILNIYAYFKTIRNQKFKVLSLK